MRRSLRGLAARVRKRVKAEASVSAEFERRFYSLADAIIRIDDADPALRQKALKSVYGRQAAQVRR